MRCRNDQDHWGALSITLHWLTALMVFALFALGLWMTSLTYYDSWYNRAPAIHKSVGVLLFLVTAVRIGWLLDPRRPEAPASQTPWERVAARLAHLFLYLLIVGVIVSGYFISTADGRPLEVFGWFSIPAAFSGKEGQEDIAGTTHLVLAITLIALAVIHTTAALKHHFIDHDRTLLRMLGR